jgi:hypothetical protein
VIGDRVVTQTGAIVLVFDGPEGAQIGSQDEGPGEVIGGPTYSSAFDALMWQVQFDDGLVGWVAEEFLTEAVGEAVVFSNVGCGTDETAAILEQAFGDRLGALHVTAPSDLRFDVARAWMYEQNMPGAPVTLRIYKVSSELQPLPEAELVAESASVPISSTPSEVSFDFASDVDIRGGQQYAFAFTADNHTWAQGDALRGAGHPWSSDCNFWDYFVEYDDHAGASPNDVYSAPRQVAVTLVLQNAGVPQ